MTDIAYPTTAASRALALPEILEAVLEHAYTASTDIRAFSTFKSVNRLWLEYTEALQVATVYIEAGDASNVLALLPRSQDTLLDVTPILKQRPELYHRIRELRLYGSSHLDQGMIPESLAAGLRAAATSAGLRTLSLRWVQKDHWRKWQDHLPRLATNLKHLELQFTFREYTADECMAFCDLISRAAQLKYLKLIYSYSIDRNIFSKVVSSAVESLESLHVDVFGRFPPEPWQAMFAESGLATRRLKVLTLGLELEGDGNINAFLPNSLQRIRLYTTPSTIKHVLRGLADPAFLPFLTSTPFLQVVLQVVGWGETVHIPGKEVEQAIEGLKRRKA